MPRYTVEPVKVKTHSVELGCDVRRTVGYRKTSDDGWRGPVRATVREARDDERDDA